ncbi:hypothetical protein [Halobellus salinus]|uniref:hypothetical protein n=1 Tax=Halobellus salinus TaxID=931585 RepID=UPI001663FA82|nr:hypothetical protein [Halobellus salinus]
MIVVATEDFEVYHDVVAELRDRGVAFTTREPGAALPDGTRIVIHAADEGSPLPVGVAAVVAAAGEGRRAVEEAVSVLRGEEGRTIVGIDPGPRPGIAVLAGGTVLAAFQVPLSEVAAVVRRETDDAPDPLIRVGDGARLRSAQLVNDLNDCTVEVVDETGTTPYLGTGVRGMGDVLAAVNIARRSGEVTDSRDVDPTPGELQRIKDRSREASEDDRSIDEGLARRVAAGELTVGEALAAHREGNDGGAGGADTDRVE